LSVPAIGIRCATHPTRIESSAGRLLISLIGLKQLQLWSTC
jgi:hypothetical protein